MPDIPARSRGIGQRQILVAPKLPQGLRRLDLIAEGEEILAILPHPEGGEFQPLAVAQGLGQPSEKRSSCLKSSIGEQVENNLRPEVVVQARRGAGQPVAQVPQGDEGMVDLGEVDTGDIAQPFEMLVRGAGPLLARIGTPERLALSVGDKKFLDMGSSGLWHMGGK
ncbi:MAG: hypothetical protein AB7E21_05710 [Pseudodonghicola sp.]